MKKKKAIRFAKDGEGIVQVAALPYRHRRGGAIEVLLVTSRRAGRFIVPKGWPMKGKTFPEAAAEEAKQEAGVVGRVGRRAIGNYRYWKRLRKLSVEVSVIVFPLKVDIELKVWREKRQRIRAWLKPGRAKSLMDNPELSSIVMRANGGLQPVMARKHSRGVRRVGHQELRPGRRAGAAARAQLRLDRMLAA
ncbi:NUDIX hydrolase [Mesorhizobium sp.]|uniref:NUDIX hydrolase n=1 Tax=Mesorhizobium sp. TaxID=1871066 RepID=UPI0026D647F2